MNKTDRLLAIVLELRLHGLRRAEDLAATFEVNKRTVYRDIEALSQAGVPIVAVPGRGYSLVEGYFLPPLTFDREEVMSLLLGADYVAQSFDAQYRAASLSATRKIEAVLSDELRAAVRDLRQGIRLISTEMVDPVLRAELLPSLRRALIDRMTVTFAYTARYTAAGGAASTVRDADPYGLLLSGGTWYLAAYCHLRKGMRNFRLDRMSDLSVHERVFERPADFALKQSPLADRTVVVRVLFRPALARWVREARSYFAVSEEDRPNGLLVTLRIRREDELIQWLLGWGAGVQVLEPESLRQRIRAEAAQLLKNYE